ncbi:hypothetical protein P9112_001888 [Eukaryota sp. TZLM1-RC]
MESITQIIMSSIHFRDNLRALLFRKFLEASCQKMCKTAVSISQKVKVPICQLLAGVVNDLSLSLDDIVVPVISQYFSSTQEDVNNEETINSYQKYFLSPSGGYYNMVRDFPRHHSFIVSLLELTADQYACNICQCLTRFSKDHSEICRWCGVDSCTKLHDLQVLQSDRHVGGQQSVLLKISNHSGVIKHIVYKPFGGQCTKFFENFTQALCLPNHLQFRVMKSLTPSPEYSTSPKSDKNDYSWNEFIHKSCCNNDGDEKLYFLRCGSIMAIAQLLQITDLHSENLIATSTSPVVVDLETVLDPFFPQMTLNVAKFQQASLASTYLIQNIPDLYETESYSWIAAFQQFSASRVFTPHYTVVNDRTTNIQFFHAETDEYQSSLPFSVHGAPLLLHDHAHIVKQGYVECWKHLQSLGHSFGEIPFPSVTRVILRDTSVYTLILKRILAGDITISTSQSTALFITRRLSDMHGFQTPNEVLECELSALLSGNVPLFFHDRTNNCFLDGSGSSFPTDTLPGCCSELLCQKYRHLAIVLSSKPATDQLYQMITVDPSVELNTVGPHAILECALELAHTALSSLLTNAQTESNFDIGLYNGLAGVVFLFSCAYIATKDQYCKEITHSLASQLISQPSTNLGISVANGISGVAYALTVAGYALQQEDFLVNAVNILFAVPLDVLSNDTTFDIIGGLAGYLCCVAAVLKYFPNISLQKREELRLRILVGARRLASGLIPQDRGAAWDTMPDESVAPLGGFSHGVSGCCYALCKCMKILESDEFTDHLNLAVKYEDSLYVAEESNWKDLRKIATSNLCAWCHGAAGITLWRSCFDIDMPHGALQSVITAAKQISDIKSDLTLCCGSTGCLDVCIELKTTPPKVVEQLVRHRLSKQNASSLALRPRHSLFRGCAGISYLLFRYMFSDDIPCVLLFN